MRKEHKRIKRFLAVALCVAMALPMAACGSRGEEEQKSSGRTEETVGDGNEYVYVPEYLDFVKTDEGTWLDNIQLSGDEVFFTSSTWDQATGETQVNIMKYSLSDQKTQSCLSYDREGDIDHFAVDEDGNFYIVASVWNYDEDTDSSDTHYYLYKYNVDGEEDYETDFTDIMQRDEDNSYVQSMEVDDKGRVYVCSDSVIRLFDEQGQYAGDIEVSADWIAGMCADKSGRVYFSYWDYNSTGTGMTMSELDFDEKKVGKTYKDIPNGNQLGVGSGESILTGDSTTLYQYDLESQTREQVLKWLDSDINGDYVRFAEMLEDGNLIAFINDWGSGDTELVKLIRTNASEVVQKTELVLATAYVSQSLQAAAVAFNKSNDTYRIRIKAYLDDTGDYSDYMDILTRLNNDLTSANAPDLIDLSTIDEKQMVGKNVLEDLTPYLEKSSRLQPEAFVDGILDNFTVDGVLTGIPRVVQLNTFVGKTSVVGDRQGWTLADMMEVTDAYPNAEIYDGVTKSDMLYYFLMLNEEAFIDWSSGSCSFDSPEFVQMLEFVNRFPEDYVWDDYDDSVSKYQENRVLLDSAYISDFQEIQIYEARFGEPVTFIGFPTVDGSGGHALLADGRYGIVSSSENKDGAWEFIEHYLTYDSTMFDWGMYTLQDKLDEQIEASTRVEYIYDEDGELMYDEDGEPLTVGGTSSLSMDGWEYTYHTPTTEDVDTVLELLSEAKPISEGFDQEIIGIIQEEAAAYFQGQKTAEDVASIIQNRLQNYVSENM